MKIAVLACYACINAQLTRHFHYITTYVVIDNGYPSLNTNHDLSYREQNTANRYG